ncbi:uncharacterized protein RBU33_027688 [Hipposideros larvatus]
MGCRRGGDERATSGRLPRPPRRPVPAGLSAAEERPVRATAAAAPTSPRRGHGGRRAGRLPALPGRRPGPGGGDGFGKRFRFKKRRRVSALAVAGGGAAGVGGRGPRPGAGRRVRPGGCSAPAPPRRRPVAAPSRCPGSRSRPGGRSEPAPRVWGRCRGRASRGLREPQPRRGRSVSRCPSSPVSVLTSPGPTLGRVVCVAAGASGPRGGGGWDAAWGCPTLCWPLSGDGSEGPFFFFFFFITF